MKYLSELKQMDTFLEPLKSALKEITPHDLDELETLYAMAYGLYDIGDYRKSAEIFTNLILQNPFETRLWKGLASTRQMQKEYKAALHAWAAAFLLDEKDLKLIPHAKECFFSIREKEETLKTLQLSLASLEGISTFIQRIQSHG